MISANTGIHNSIIVKQSLSLKSLISTIVEEKIKYSQYMSKTRYFPSLTDHNEVDVVDVTKVTNNLYPLQTLDGSRLVGKNKTTKLRRRKHEDKCHMI